MAGRSFIFENFVDQVGDDIDFENPSIIKVLQFLKKYSLEPTESLSTFVKEFYDLDNTNDQYKDEVEQLRKKVSEQAISLNLQKKMLQQHAEELNQLRENLDFQDDVNRALKKLFEKDRRDMRLTRVCYEKQQDILHNEYSEEMENCLDRLAELRSELHDYTVKEHSTQVELDNARRAVIDLGHQVSILEDEVAANDESITTLEEEICQKEYDIMNMTKDLRNENESSKDLLMNEIYDLNDELYELGDKLIDFEDLCEDLKEERGVLRIESVLLKKLMLIRENETIPRSWVMEAHNRNQAYVKELWEENTKLRTENGFLVECKMDLSNQVRTLDAELRVKNESDEELEVAEDRIADLNHENVVLRGEITKLIDRIEELTQETDTLSVGLAEATSKGVDFEIEITSLKSKVEELVEDFSYTEKADMEAIKNLREHLNDTTAKNHGLEEDICKLKAEITCLEADQDSIEDKIADYEEQIAHFESYMADYDEYIAEYDGEMENLFKELSGYEELKRKYVKLQADHAKLQADQYTCL